MIYAVIKQTPGGLAQPMAYFAWDEEGGDAASNLRIQLRRGREVGSSEDFRVVEVINPFTPNQLGGYVGNQWLRNPEFQA